MTQPKRASTGYEYFKTLWEEPQPDPILSCPDMWDERADEWNKQLTEDTVYRARMMERVAATAGFLRRHDLLGPDSQVLDIGCGPGLFCTSFAETAGHVTGVDISPRMVHHAQRHAQQQGATNTRFLALDFKRESLASLGWQKQFDLVMTSITPAVTSVEDLHKVMAICRGHCFHVSFVESSDSLETRVATELYGDSRDAVSYWDGRVFYAVFNLLFLDGYNPQTYYFQQSSEETADVDEVLAERYARSIRKNRPEHGAKTGQILDYLRALEKKEGRLKRQLRSCFGFLLWDVNQKRRSRTGYGCTANGK